MKNEKGWTRLAVKYKLFSEHDTEHEPKTNDNRKRYPPMRKKIKRKEHNRMPAGTQGTNGKKWVW